MCVRVRVQLHDHWELPDVFAQLEHAHANRHNNWSVAFDLVCSLYSLSRGTAGVLRDRTWLSTALRAKLVTVSAAVVSCVSHRSPPPPNTSAAAASVSGQSNSTRGGGGGGGGGGRGKRRIEQMRTARAAAEARASAGARMPDRSTVQRLLPDAAVDEELTHVQQRTTRALRFMLLACAHPSIQVRERVTEARVRANSRCMCTQAYTAAEAYAPDDAAVNAPDVVVTTAVRSTATRARPRQLAMVPTSSQFGVCVCVCVYVFGQRIDLVHVCACVQ
jgi:hypothetical protein